MQWPCFCQKSKVRGVAQEKTEPKNVTVAQTDIIASTPLATRFFSHDGVSL